MFTYLFNDFDICWLAPLLLSPVMKMVCCIQKWPWLSYSPLLYVWYKKSRGLAQVNEKRFVYVYSDCWVTNHTVIEHTAAYFKFIFYQSSCRWVCDSMKFISQLWLIFLAWALWDASSYHILCCSYLVCISHRQWSSTFHTAVYDASFFCWVSKISLYIFIFICPHDESCFDVLFL